MKREEWRRSMFAGDFFFSFPAQLSLSSLPFLLHSLVLRLQPLTEEGFKKSWSKSDRDGPERDVL